MAQNLEEIAMIPLRSRFLNKYCQIFKNYFPPSFKLASTGVKHGTPCLLGKITFQLIGKGKNTFASI
jgi:hypothetical protein